MRGIYGIRESFDPKILRHQRTYVIAGKARVVEMSLTSFDSQDFRGLGTVDFPIR